MTALSMFVFSDCVILASDAIAYDDDGVVRQIHSKQVLAPQIDCVMAASGSGPIKQYIDHYLSIDSPSDFDALVDLMPSITHKIYQNMLETYQVPTHFMVLLGGWSKSKNRYRGFYIVSDDSESLGCKAFEMQSCTAFSKPNPDVASLTREGIADLELAQRELDSVSLVVRLMLAQRTSLMGLHGEANEKGYGVGGFCQVTRLQQDNLLSFIPVRWPDVIGEKIDPSRAAVFSPHFVSPEEPVQK